MQVRVLQFGMENRSSRNIEQLIECDPNTRLSELLDTLFFSRGVSVPNPEKTLSTINGKSVSLDALLCDGDEVAILARAARPLTLIGGGKR